MTKKTKKKAKQKLPLALEKLSVKQMVARTKKKLSTKDKSPSRSKKVAYPKYVGRPFSSHYDAPPGESIRDEDLIKALGSDAVAISLVSYLGRKQAIKIASKILTVV